MQLYRFTDANLTDAYTHVWAPVGEWRDPPPFRRVGCWRYGGGWYAGPLAGILRRLDVDLYECEFEPPLRPGAIRNGFQNLYGLGRARLTRKVEGWGPEAARRLANACAERASIHLGLRAPRGAPSCPHECALATAEAACLPCPFRAAWLACIEALGATSAAFLLTAEAPRATIAPRHDDLIKAEAEWQAGMLLHLADAAPPL